MKKRFLFLFGTALLLSTGAALASPITIETSCGKTVIVNSEDFKNTEELLKRVEKINDAMCDEIKPTSQSADTI
ncbi:hypothetical protein [Porphyromonas levii]|uniref:hypothetical protein n=1 Tax=Porphyromonas levii TaxID=28114 RepID=UPI000362502C|nr:hypothetical protein [Porphyromonas levii]MBR8704151.1 hypothetical protein [Porphyromonas levii]MBR8712434.1 hypothetical protein [Porphyromonas levii]MBR8714394.1 hypothetical protein [Porphyromonas levii]MBR8726935.1 hypothetical protein [Porphyromonas levii]MBR8728902.1 hypothetical protein [Porphyromonas levii]